MIIHLSHRHSICIPHSNPVIDCGDLPAPANGQVDLGNGTVFGSVAVYSCNERFELNGPAELRTCQDSGSWSEVAPTCESQS